MANKKINVNNFIRSYRAAKKAEEKAKKRIAELQAQAAAIMDEQGINIIESADGKLTRSTFMRKSLNTELLKVEQADIYNNYLRETSTTRYTLK